MVLPATLSFVLTFVLGTAAAVAFYLVGGQLALNGPYVFLFLASGVVADELTVISAVGYWLLATGGLLQPAMAFLGGWLGLRPRGAR